MSDLFAPVCSITKTKRRRFFWAAWWSGPPTRVPFKKPDAEGGGVATLEEALLAAEEKAEQPLTMIDPLWARAWIRIIRGDEAWPSKASREPSRPAAEPRSEVEPGSLWELLGITREATEVELKAAFRKRVLEAHPDQGGDTETFRRLLRAHEEAQRRLRRPRAR